MKVSQLIALLSSMPPDTPVRFASEHADHGCLCPEDVGAVDIATLTHDGVWSGEDEDGEQIVLIRY